MTQNTGSEEMRFLSLREVSKKYSMPLSTVRRWASERKFPLYKISNRIKVSSKDFDTWISEFKINPSEDKY